MLYRISFAVALVATLGGCTVLNLDGFDLPDCQTEAMANPAFVDGDHLCSAILNERNGFPTADRCRPFACRNSGGQRSCVLSAEETRCDGYDNDCDGLVDEGLQDLFDPRAVETEDNFFRTGHTGNDLASVSVAPGLANITVTFTDVDDDAWSFRVAGPSSSDPEDFKYGHNMVNQPWPRTSEMLTPDQCWRQSYPGAGTGAGGAPEFASTNCSFASIATDRVQGVGLIAAINTRAGCVDGQLRVGHTTAEEPDIFQVNGPWERSNSFLGLGLTSDGRCTATETAACQAAIEATQEDDVCMPGCAAGEFCSAGTCAPAVACTTDDGCMAGGRCLCGECVSAAQYDRAQYCGVSDVAIAGTTPVSDQTRGVVAFTSGSRQYRCANFERDVAISGAALINSAGATSLDFVTTTNEAVPQVLGQTRAASAPAVYGLEDQYVIAYPTPASDGLAVHVIDGFPDLTAAQPTFTTATCIENVGGETVTCDGPQAVCGLTDCGTDVGVCASGERTCFRGEGICDGHIAGGDEVCGSGADEDCDGVIDEDPDGRPCITMADCSARADLCDAIDNDCDGAVDEDFVGAACGTNMGACVAGTEVCSGGKVHCMGSVDRAENASGNGIEYVTPVVAGFPYGMGIDDDCDGDIDETSEVTSCTGTGETEFCNGRDDDQDCAIDEDSPRLRPADLLDTPEQERPREVVRQCLEEPAFPELPAQVVEGGLGWGIMDDISIAGTTFARGNEIAIGVAWREQSETDASMSRIGFRVLRFETDCTCLMPGTVECGDTLCSESTIESIAFIGATDPVEVTVAPGNYGPPHVSYQPRGVIVAGTTRSGREVERDGGFVVVYTQPQSSADMVFRDAAMVRSFAEHDGLARDATCNDVYDECVADAMAAGRTPNCGGCSANITVTGIPGEMRGIPDVDFPRSYFDQQLQETRYLYFDNRNREFVSYGFVCSGEE